MKALALVLALLSGCYEADVNTAPMEPIPRCADMYRPGIYCQVNYWWINGYWGPDGRWVYGHYATHRQVPRIRDHRR